MGQAFRQRGRLCQRLMLENKSFQLHTNIVVYEAGDHRCRALHDRKDTFSLFTTQLLVDSSTSSSYPV
ncbi:hypothetical protein M378DRAFT_163828 [Amanita muscaria Koide BX008]|uniref:Uncharacterized protein n=1 Tax=Amanita muscaria (strain Koide BX008) TaxID=946122 RepID=A0A0C2TAZ0_AMAMK|nr:hypothetical protein M378DRAFT_163828 [Amanita muscaria Koide BX008]